MTMLMLRAREMEFPWRNLASCSSAKRRESSRRGSPAKSATKTTNQIYQWPRLAKDVFHFLKQAAWLRFVFHLRGAGQLREQFTLALGQFGGSDYLDLHVQVAFASSFHRGYALAANAENCSRLRAFRHLELVLALQGTNHDLCAQGRLSKRNRYGAIQIFALA